MSQLQTIFGKQVRALREARGWSQDELGKAAKLGGKYIGLIERAERTASFPAIERIAAALDVRPHELFMSVPSRSDAASRSVKVLIEKRRKVNPEGVERFLKSLDDALRFLD